MRIEGLPALCALLAGHVLGRTSLVRQKHVNTEVVTKATMGSANFSGYAAAICAIEVDQWSPSAIAVARISVVAHIVAGVGLRNEELLKTRTYSADNHC